MNKLILCGNLTKTPQFTRVTKEGKETLICNFAVATNYKDTAEFFNCTAFGRLAEIIFRDFDKGSKILISGHVHLSWYTDADGSHWQNINCIVEDFDYCEKKVIADGENQNA